MECSPTQVSARTTPHHTTQHIPAMTHHTLNVVRLAYATGKVNGQVMQILLDSGASCSAISKQHVKIDHVLPGQCTKLVNADGRAFQPLGKSPMTVSLGEFSANHTFIAVEQLSVPVILGCDFLSQYGLILDIQGGTVYQSGSPDFRLQLELTCVVPWSWIMSCLRLYPVGILTLANLTFPPTFTLH